MRGNPKTKPDLEDREPASESAADPATDELARTKMLGTLARVLGLSKTGHKILEVLATTREQLSVRELVNILKRSERSVREHLRILLEKNVLVRKVDVTPANKLAYRYSLRPLDALIAVVRREMTKQLAEFERLATRKKRKHAVPAKHRP